MNNAIKSGIITALLSMSVHGNAAIYCQGDAECLSKGISLIKKAAQNGCDARGVAETLKSNPRSQDDFDASAVQSVEVCIEKAKYGKSLAKKSLKKLERIEKALATPVKN